MPSRFRVIVQDVDTANGRGPGDVAAIIYDAKDIGAAEQVNGAGEFFMTLPMNHIGTQAILPHRSHYTVQRWNDTAYVNIFRGLIDDYEATPDEVVYYGVDYLGLVNKHVTSSNTSYSSQYIGNIIADQYTVGQSGANSQFGFIPKGTIDQTSTTTIAISAFQPRLDFLSQLADISMADRTVRSIIQVAPRTSNSLTFNFTENQGQDRPEIPLRYGGIVNDYWYPYGQIWTQVRAIGQKREGASVLYSTQSYASPAIYGVMQTPQLYVDIIDQAALDDKAKRAAYIYGRSGRQLGLGIRSGALAPWDGYDLGDSFPVRINDGFLSVDRYYTLWGLEWIGRKNGSEEIVLSLLPKDE